MAWRCSGRSNAELIANLKMSRLIRNARVEQAMLSVDRSGYCLPTTDAYRDAPQTIGYSATISAPHMHAWCLELLEPFLQPGSKVLDVGSGSGYLTACFAKMVSPGGKAFGIEHIQELVDWSVRNTQQSNGELFREGVISFQVADGFNGLSEHACYNAIHVGAAAPSIPQALLDQLCPGGRMVIPVGTWDQSLVQVDKDRDGHVTQSTITGVRYVPLTTREKQIR